MDGFTKKAIAVSVGSVALAAGLAIWAATKASKDDETSDVAAVDLDSQAAGMRSGDDEAPVVDVAPEATKPINTPIDVAEVLASGESTPQMVQAALAKALEHSAYARLQRSYIQIGAFRTICALPLSSTQQQLIVLALQVIANYAAKEESHDDMILSGLLHYLCAVFWDSAKAEAFTDKELVALSAFRCAQNLSVTENGALALADAHAIPAIIAGAGKSDRPSAVLALKCLCNILTYDDLRLHVASSLGKLYGSPLPALTSAEYKAGLGRLSKTLLGDRIADACKTLAEAQGLLPALEDAAELAD